MSGPTLPLSLKELSVKREFSTPPEPLQESAADAMSNDALKDRLLMKALEKELSSGNVADPPPNNTEVEMQNASSHHNEAVSGETLGSLSPQTSGASSQATRARCKVRDFPDDISNFSDGENNISSDESGSLFIPKLSVTPSRSPQDSDRPE
jgi:hypothetical protein